MPEHESYRVVVSKRAAQQLVEHAAFAARLDEKLAHKLVSGFRQAAVSLERFPFRNPVLRSEVFTVEKYRKLIFDKYHILLYQVKDQVVCGVGDRWAAGLSMVAHSVKGQGRWKQNGTVAKKTNIDRSTLLDQ